LASILTGGSLLLGFSILRRDHRLSERSQVDRVGVWVEGVRLDDHTAAIKIHLRNASDLPIKGVQIRASAEVAYHGSAAKAPLVVRRLKNVLGPGRREHWTVRFSLEKQAESAGTALDPASVSINYVGARPDDIRMKDNAGRLWAMGRDETMRPSRETGEQH
jgi:hypothetical protein